MKWRRVHNQTTILPHHRSSQCFTPRSVRKGKNHNSFVSERQLARIIGSALVIIIVPISVQAARSLPVTSAEESALLALAERSADPLSEAMPTLTAAKNPRALAATGGSDIKIVDGTLVKSGSGQTIESSGSKNTVGEISVYTVREGDSLSEIAEMFNVTANTILWANDITSAKAIQPGDTLVILPVAGVRHVVKKGDTVASLAKKYEGDTEEIINFNKLEDEELTIGATLVIPGGKIAAPAVAKKASGKASAPSTTGASVGGGLSHPVPGAIKTQGIHGYNAVDFAGSVGTAIYAAAGGEVIVSKNSGWNGGYGNYVVVKHANGVQTLYAHLSSAGVAVGDTVSAGEVIGAMGNTGKSTGPHLHFEVRGGRNPF